MIKNKKILITGIYGFLGKHLAEQLQHDNEIIGINLPNKLENFECNNTSIIEGDISISKTLEQIKTDIDLIFHFGAPTSVVLFKENPDGCFNTTINGMKNILEFAKER